MKESFPDRKALIAWKVPVAAIVLLLFSPILVTSFLVLYIRLRYRGAGASNNDKSDIDIPCNPHVQTMSEAMEIIRAIPFKTTVPTFLARLANRLIETVPNILNEVPHAAGLVYPYPEPFEPVIVESFDGTPLSGVLAMQPGEAEKPALLFVHGLFGSKNAFGVQAMALRAYYDWGFHVYALDLRNSGDSSRFSEAPTSWGYRESDDVLAGAEYLESMDRVTTVGVCGLSMGAASALLAASRSRFRRLLSGGVVALNSYADARRAMEQLSTTSEFLLKSIAVRLASRLMMGFKTLAGGPRPIGDIRSYTREVAAQYYEISDEELYRKASPINIIAEIEVPCLIIHALDDRTVSVEEAYDLLAASADNPVVDALVVPSGGHAIYQLTSPNWFDRTLETFFAYWAEPGREGQQYTGTSGTDTIDTLGNQNN